MKSFEKLVMLLVGPVLSGLGNGVRFSDLLILILHVEGVEEVKSLRWVWVEGHHNINNTNTMYVSLQQPLTIVLLFVLCFW